LLAEVQFEDVDGIPIARVRGEVDMSNAGELGATLQNSVAHVSAGLVVDFTTTEYLDSAGLHFVFDLAKRLRDRGQRLHLVVPDTSPVATVLEIVQIDSLAPRSQTVDEAIDKLRAHAADVPPPAA
jgi:anti-anti-sigma factor